MTNHVHKPYGGRFHTLDDATGLFNVVNGLSVAGVAQTTSIAEVNTLASSGITNADLVKVHAVASTAAEIDLVADVSANTETIVAAGAVTLTKRLHKLAVVGGGAITLAAPDAANLGVLHVIEMTTDDGDVTLALTNVNGGSAATTCTFNSVADALILVGGVTKWHVVAEAGVALT